MIMIIKVFETFAGYGSQSLALERLKRNYHNFDYEIVGISEIDKYAVQAYNTLHPNVHNYGDISKIDWNTVPDFDLFTYSFPCTDISKAGKQKGLERGSGTHSSLLWECQKAIEIKRPKYLLMENVSALVQKKFISFFYKWQRILENYGYYNFSQIMNAKDYGVPQNRERIFMISIFGESQYYFPQPFESELRLKNILEYNVDKKYYLSKKYTELLKENYQTDNFVKQVGNIVDDTHIGFKNPQRGRVYSIDGISPCLNCHLVPQIIIEKYEKK